jgi:thioredoxin-dependent peroxiredoxin
VGISADQVDRQRQFDEKNQLGFPLLSDRDRKISRRFGVKRPGLLPGKRRTFVIGTDRRLLGQIASETNMDTHADRALLILREHIAG